MTDKQLSLNALKWSYITAFLIILILAMLNQSIVQYSLHQESIARQVSTLLASQSVYSQHLQRDSLLLYVPGDHASIVREMKNDLAGLEANHVLFRDKYDAIYPQLSQVSYGPGAPPYTSVDAAAHAIITIEQENLPDKQREKAEATYTKQMFFDGNQHLSAIQQAQSIVDADTDSYIIKIQIIELVIFGLTVLILLFEVFVVIRPAQRRLQQAEQAEAATGQPPTVQPI